MKVEQVWLAAGGAVALLLLVAVLVLATAVRRLGTRVRVLEEEATRGVDPRADAAGAPAAVPAAYVITGIDGDREAGLGGGLDAHADAAQPAVVQGRIDGALFADIVAREGVIKAAGLAHGLRRALAPATRNRIRFEMKREVKRSRRQRRADLKAALRDMQARERSGEADLRDGEDAA